MIKLTKSDWGLVSSCDEMGGNDEHSYEDLEKGYFELVEKAEKYDERQSQQEEAPIYVPSEVRSVTPREKLEEENKRLKEKLESIKIITDDSMKDDYYKIDEILEIIYSEDNGSESDI